MIEKLIGTDKVKTGLLTKYNNLVDETITGVTFNNNILSLNLFNGNTFDVIVPSGDTYTTGATLNNGIVTFTRNDGNIYNLDLQSLTDTIYLSGDVIGSGTTAITTSVNWTSGYTTYDSRYIKNVTTDYELSKQFNNIELISADKQIVTLPNGFDYIHGSCIVGNYLFGGCRTTPGKIIKLQLDDLTVQTSVTFPNDGKHRNSESLVYNINDDRIYIVHTDDYYGQHLYITKLNPNDLTYEDVLNTTVGYNIYNAVAETDGTYLYLLMSAPSSGVTLRVRKYLLSDLSYVGELNTGLNGYGHAIKYDGESLWVTTTYRYYDINHKQYIIKIEPITFTMIDNILVPVNSFTDDIAIVGDYIYCGVEYNNTTFDVFTIVRTNKSNLSDFGYLTLPFTGSCYSVKYDNKYIWALSSSSPGKIIRIDPETLITNIFTTPIGEDSPNEFLTDGNNYYFTYFQTPAKVSKYNKIEFQENLLLSLNKGVIFDFKDKISNNSYSYSSWSGDTTSGATRQSLANKFNSIDNNFNNYLPLSGYTSGVTGGSYVNLTTDQYDISGIKSFINLSGNTISGSTYYLTDLTGNTKSIFSIPNSNILRIGENYLKTQFNTIQILDTNDGLYKDAISGGFNSLIIGNGYGSLTTPSTIRSSSGSININSNTAGNTVSLSTLGATNTNNGIRLFTAQWTNTSGNALNTTIEGGFNVNSGVGNYTMLSLYSSINNNAINQRNSATGVITCLDVNPTVINVASGGTLYGIRSRINNITSGNTFNIYADGTAPNYFAGSNYFYNTTTGKTISNTYQQYSSIVSGNTVPYFMTSNGDIIKLFKNNSVTTIQAIADVLTNVGLLENSIISNGGGSFIAATEQEIMDHIINDKGATPLNIKKQTIVTKLILNKNYI